MRLVSWLLSSSPRSLLLKRWKEDKAELIDKYYEYGYRDAQILEDSVSNYDEKHVNVYVKVDEGKQYFIRNITWVGNTVY